MKTTIFGALCGIVVFIGTAQAGTVQSACLQSDKAKANRSMCSCIQSAADATLNSSDQNLAASLIRDPEKSQKIKSSNSRSHEKFWERYEQFGQLAKAFCS